MNSLNRPTVPAPLLVEFDPGIRLGDIISKLGPDYIAKAMTNGRVRIVPKTAHEKKKP